MDEKGMVKRQEEIKRAVEQAEAFVIKNNYDFALVDAHCKALLELRKRVIEDFAESKKAANEAWKKIVAQESGHLDKIDAVREIDKRKMSEWEKKEAIRIEEANRIAQEEARKLAEKNQLDLAAQAERAGDKEVAQAILEAPVMPVSVKLSESLPKRSTVIRKTYKAVVVNPAMVPQEYWMIDQSKLDAVARATKGTLKIPGVDIVESQG